MALDGIFLNRLLTEIGPELIGAKINRVHQPDKHTVTFKLNTKTRGNATLLLSAHPQNPRLHFTDASFENPPQPPLFAMVLRKHVEGGRIVAVAQNGLDRVVDITVEARNDIGDVRELRLVVEIMGKHSNIILLDDANVILAAVKPYGSTVSRHRRVLPGEPYVAPPATEKANPFLLDEEAFADLLLDNDLSLTLREAVLRKIEGVSPATARELLYRAALDADFPLEEAGVYEFQSLFRSLNDVLTGEVAPTLCRRDGKTVDFYHQALLHYDATYLPCPDLSNLLDDFYGAKERENAFNARRTSLLKIVSLRRDKTAKKVAKQRVELDRAVDGEKYRLYGELISANLYRIDDHIKEVTLENFYDDDVAITIPLKEELTASENAGRYFKRYNKTKQSRDAIREHLAENEAELAYLESLCFEAETADDDEALAEFRRELEQNGYIRRRQKSKEKRQAPLPPIETVYDGYTIRIGRNNKQNDKLTLRLAQKDDIWLHTKDIPGSHVIITKKDGAEIPAAVIVRAAQYAAFHSKAQASAKVPVDYTEVRQVKKPNGARPGMVIYFEQTTLMVEPLAEPAPEEDREP